MTSAISTPLALKRLQNHLLRRELVPELLGRSGIARHGELNVAALRRYPAVEGCVLRHHDRQHTGNGPAASIRFTEKGE